MSISWEQFISPNFKTEFYLKNILCLDDDEKTSYEEFLDFPMLSNSDMYFGNSIDKEYLTDVTDINWADIKF